MLKAGHVGGPLPAGLVFTHLMVISEGSHIARYRRDGIRLSKAQAIAFGYGFVGCQPVKGALIVIFLPLVDQRQDAGSIAALSRCDHVNHHRAASALVHLAIAFRVMTSLVTLLGGKITQPGDRRLPFRPTAKDRKDIRRTHRLMLSSESGSLSRNADAASRELPRRTCSDIFRLPVRRASGTRASAGNLRAASRHHLARSARLAA
jgi:hypothetical protein